MIQSANGNEIQARIFEQYLKELHQEEPRSERAIRVLISIGDQIGFEFFGVPSLEDDLEGDEQGSADGSDIRVSLR